MRKLEKKIVQWVLAGALAASGLIQPSWADDKPSALGELNRDVQKLTQKIGGTIVRVHLDQTQDLSPGLKTAFDKWQKDFGGARGRNGDGRGPGAGGRGMGGMGGGGGLGAAGGAGQPGGFMGVPGGGGRGFELRRFLDERMNTTKDPLEIAEIRAFLARTGQSDMGAVMIDNAGHALLLMPLLKNKEHPLLKATLPDNTETNATIVGVDFVRGMTMLKLETHGATFATISGIAPVPGEILMTVTANRETNSLMVTPIAGRPDDDHFPIATPDDRGPTFMFDISGKLTAINLGGRQGLPLATLDEKLAQLLLGKDLIPTPIGIRYSSVPDSSDYRLSTAKVAAPLGTQPAAQVTSVIPGSLAEKAGFQPHDFLVAIDGKPLSPQFFTNPPADLENRTGAVTFGIIRDKLYDRKTNTNSTSPVWTEVELKLDLDQR